MDGITFDYLAYFEKLKAADVPEAQAFAQADALRTIAEAQERRIDRAIAGRDSDLATKEDLRIIDARIKEIDARVREIDGRVKELDGRVKELDIRVRGLEVHIKDVELRLLKWQLGIGFSLALIMAKGFGWLGF